jgi:hypothetical protein
MNFAKGIDSDLSSPLQPDKLLLPLKRTARVIKTVIKEPLYE